MGDTVTMVSGIEYKIRKVIDQYEALTSEKDKLNEELTNLKQINETQKKEIEQLENKIELLKLANPASQSGGDREAKARVNELLREIDKCIGLLNTKG